MLFPDLFVRLPVNYVTLTRVMQPVMSVVVWHKRLITGGGSQTFARNVGRLRFVVDQPHMFVLVPHYEVTFSFVDILCLPRVYFGQRSGLGVTGQFLLSILYSFENSQDIRVHKHWVLYLVSY